VQIWQSNCSGRRVLRAPMDASKEQFNAVNGRSLIQILLLLVGNDMPLLGLRRRIGEYGRMRM